MPKKIIIIEGVSKDPTLTSFQFCMLLERWSILLQSSNLLELENLNDLDTFGCENVTKLIRACY